MNRKLLAAATGLASLAGILCAACVPAALAEGSAAAASMVGVAVRNFLPQSYHAHRQNWAIVQDNRGILFFGNTTGVLEFDGTRWRRIELPGGRGAYALGKASDGRILVGSEGEVGWLAPDRNGAMGYVSRSADLPEAFRTAGDRVIQILDTPIGQVFLSDHWLLVRPSSGALTVLRSEDHFLQAAWFQGALHVLDSGRGLTRMEGGTLRNIAGGGQLRGLTMLVTSAGLLIPSYNDGLVLYVPGAANPWQFPRVGGWTAADGADVTSSVALTGDLLAFGTAKHGVALIDTRAGTLQRIGTAQGVADAHVYSVGYDHRGGLWLALDNGVSLLSLSLPKDPSALPFRSWVRGVTGTRDEHMLFGGTFSPGPGAVQQLEQDSAQKLRFPFKYNAFRIDYSANGLEASNDMEFQTFMEGVDTAWSGWSTRSEREFTELRPGRWVFKVRSRRSDGEISAEGAYEFRVLQAWYETWWFALIQVAFVLGMLLLSAHARVNKNLQDPLTTFSVIVPFSYVSAALSSTIGHYSSGVVFFKVLMSSLLSFTLDPMKKRLKKTVQSQSAEKAGKK